MEIAKELNARGLACPMPLIKARQEVNQLQTGQILKVISTDRGSIKDFQGWVKTAKNIELIKQETETQDGQELYIHYIQKKG